MSYKRAARVAFFSADGALANAAVRTAESLGGGWLVATAAACDRLGEHATPDGSGAVGRGLWSQQDLLVSLDEPARSWLAELALSVPTRHYGVDNLPSADQLPAVEQRVKSMVAGMRMFARGSVNTL